MALVLFLVVLALVSVAVGQRSRHPILAERALIADPSRRSAVAGLYLLGGLDRYIAQCAERFVPISPRYGASPYDLRHLWVFVATAPSLIAAALYLGWLVFGIDTYGHWQFFRADPSAIDAARYGLVFFMSFAISLYFTCDWDAVMTAADRINPALPILLQWILIVVILSPPLLVYGNNGLVFLLALGPVVRGFAGGTSGALGLASAVGMIVYKDHVMGAALTGLFAYGALTGGLAWIVLRTHVALMALAWWNGWDGARLLLACVGAVPLALAAVALAPFVFAAMISAASPILPAGFLDQWAQIVDSVTGGGPSVLLVLVLASITPLIPVIAFAIYGAGSAIGNGRREIQSFLTKLETTQGPLSHAALDALLQDRCRAYLFGYSVATGATLMITALALVGIWGVMNTLVGPF